MAAALFIVLPSCNPDKDPLEHFTDGVTVTTSEPTFITGTTACCGAEVTVDDNGLLIEMGVCWSTSSNPTVDDMVVKTRKCTQPFVGLLTNLEPNTEYHVRGYAQYGTEYCYGEEKTFTTLNGDVPASSPVTTMPAYDINEYGFTSEVVLTPFGADYFNLGVCYSKNPEFTFEDCDGYVLGGYPDNNRYHAYCYCYNLSPNTQYYYRAFVGFSINPHNEFDQFFYGEILSFTTPDIPLNLDISIDYTYYDYWEHYLVVSGYLNCNKPDVVDEVGICYSDTHEYPQFESDLHTTVGTPTGEWYNFSGHIYDLSASTKYYLRPYARYMNDSIKYGNVKEVNTY